VYPGGWTDYQRQRKETQEVLKTTGKSAPKPQKTTPKASADSKSKLSFTEKHRLEELPEVLARLESEIVKIGELMADPELFTKDPVKFQKATEMMGARQAMLEAAEEEWMMLEEKNGA
jgi:ATP-binding cassette subfamily F protein uup